MVLLYHNKISTTHPLGFGRAKVRLECPARLLRAHPLLDDAKLDPIFLGQAEQLLRVF